jgi:CubicO group peptidase (beta-lactamase class C family)
LTSIVNPDLAMRPSGLVSWNEPDQRRQSLRRLRDLVRYGLTIRAPKVRVLHKDVDPRIARLERFARLSADDAFSSVVVVRDDAIIHERYANDFEPEQVHSIMSLSKTSMALAVGRQVAEGNLELSARVGDYLPEIGSAYADATVQDVLDMNWSNDYSEDFADPYSDVWRHEWVAGWRVVPEDPPPLREFLASLGGGRPNASGETDYKDANSDVLAWLVERVSGRSVRDHILALAEAAGIEHTLFVGCDRTFLPVVSFGISMTARDTARWGRLLLDGLGVDGQQVGDLTFLRAATTNPGSAYRLNGRLPDRWHYSNHLVSNGRWIGHIGYAGQWLAVDHQTRTILLWFSVLESFSGMEDEYHADLYQSDDDLFDMLSND